jgi:DNA-binding PadR family transcriptional regulator
MVLGLLSKSPMHGYEIQKALEVSRADVWADVLPGSIYHALKKMTAEGLLEVQATEQTGFRLKATYAVTEAGQVEFRRLLRETWTLPPKAFPTGLYTAMTFLEALPPEEVLPGVEVQIGALAQEIARWNEAEERKAPFLPDYARLMFANGREHLEADLRLLESLKNLLEGLKTRG